MLLLSSVGVRAHDGALAQDTTRALARDASPALMQNTMHSPAQDTVHALLPDTTHALTAGRVASGVDDPDSVCPSPAGPLPSFGPAREKPTPVPLVAAVIPLRDHNLSDSVLSGPDTPAWPARKILATGAVGGIFVGSLIGSYFDWWVDASRSFHFTDDGLFNNYSLGIDKVGHAYTSYFYFHTFRNVMRWGGYEERTAYWWAAGISAFFALSVEIGDGLSPFGFSAWDLSFNMLGLAYGMAQTSVPFLQNFKLKWSYVPPDGYRWPPRFTEHYDGHIYWVTCNVHNLLPESAQHWWPEFLQLAVGYGVDDRQTRREMMVGLDLNLCVFQTQQPELRLLGQTVDLFHIPMPSVKLTEGKTPRYYLIGWN